MLLPNPFHWRRTQFSTLQVLWFGRSGRWLSRIFHVYWSHLDFTIPKWVMNSFLGEAAVEKMLSVDLIILDTLRSTAPPTILLWLSIGDFSTKRKQVFDPELLILVVIHSSTAHWDNNSFFVHLFNFDQKLPKMWRLTERTSSTYVPKKGSKYLNFHAQKSTFTPVCSEKSARWRCYSASMPFEVKESWNADECSV